MRFLDDEVPGGPRLLSQRLVKGKKGFENRI
jgi:hypothetical protein